MALDPRRIDRIFARMLVRYGILWTRMWEGIEADAVKTDWAHELGRVSHDAIEYGLDHLPPDKPPTVTQFRALCGYHRPKQEQRKLPMEKVDPEKVEEALAKLRSLRERPMTTAWSDSLEERERLGDRLTPAQRQMWRDARRERGHENASILVGEFRGIDPATLPPGMREGR